MRVETEVDQLVNDLETEIKIEKLGNGFYLFGTKKYYCKVMNG